MKFNYILLITTSLILSSLAEELIKLSTLTGETQYVLFKEGAYCDKTTDVTDPSILPEQVKTKHLKPKQKSKHQFQQSKRPSNDSAPEVRLEDESDEEVVKLNIEDKKENISANLIPYVSENDLNAQGIKRILYNKGVFTLFHSIDPKLETLKFYWVGAQHAVNLAIIELKLIQLDTVKVDWGIVIPCLNMMITSDLTFKTTIYISRNFLQLTPQVSYKKLPHFFQTEENKNIMKSNLVNLFTDKLIQVDFDLLDTLKLVRGKKWFDATFTFKRNGGKQIYIYTIGEFLPEKEDLYDFFLQLCYTDQRFQCLDINGRKIVKAI
jgi:hypothetical protein